MDATEWEDPDLTRRHYGWIYRGDAAPGDIPAPSSPLAAASANSPPAYRWVPYDVVEALVAGEMAVARKSIVMTDAVFVNHFRRTPVVPGVFLLQSMVEVCRALLGASSPPGHFWRLTAIEAARLRRRVCPGDHLVIEARLKELTEDGASLACEGRVWGEARAMSLRSASFLAEPDPQTPPVILNPAST